jgi:hypothetical protein
MKYFCICIIGSIVHVVETYVYGEIAKSAERGHCAVLAGDR